MRPGTNWATDRYRSTVGDHCFKPFSSDFQFLFHTTLEFSISFSHFRLALYVYEYLLHVGAQKSAQTFLSEVRWHLRLKQAQNTFSSDWTFKVLLNCFSLEITSALSSARSCWNMLPAKWAQVLLKAKRLSTFLSLNVDLSKYTLFQVLAFTQQDKH